MAEAAGDQDALNVTDTLQRTFQFKFFDLAAGHGVATIQAIMGVRISTNTKYRVPTVGVFVQRVQQTSFSDTRYIQDVSWMAVSYVSVCD